LIHSILFGFRICCCIPSYIFADVFFNSAAISVHTLLIFEIIFLFKMSRPQGRSLRADKDIIIEKVLERKEEILLKNNKKLQKLIKCARKSPLS